MVGAAPQVLDQQQQSLPQTLSSEEEEAIKRNTDCVYFLASPLTCKKGSECEYRHSEYARVNPRDCWFWLNGNCLNLKCGFRHPPLDGLVGTHTTNPTSSQIPSQTSAIVSTPNPFNASKQAVPCIFFQKGLCLKGDRCAFLHGPSPASTNKVSPAPANAQAGERPSLKKISGGIQRCSQEQRIAQANFSKSVGAPPKLAAKDETMASMTGNNNENNGSATEVDDGGSRFKAIINSHLILNESSLSRTNQLQQSHVSDDYGLQNGKDVDEFLKESSPGFDVLVDDELRGSGYYGSEETYGRTRGHEGTNMISMNEYVMGHSADYKMVSDIDQDIYNDVVDYDYDDSRQRQYGWEKHRTSSEKLSLGSVHMESRLIQKSNSPECVQDMDLRHRLNKHRRVNGLRSVVNNDNAASRSVEERNYRASRRESEESSISSRLRGRIKPRIPSPVRNSNLRPERDLSRVRHWGRLSPGRSQSSSYLGSVRDEIKGRVEEDYNNERRNFNSLSSRRDRIDGTFDFAPPKSLAELKGEKSLVSKEQQMLGKRKSLAYNEQSEGEVSFKGPKSLNEILKKKRQVEADVKLPVNNAESENRERLMEHSATTILKQSGLSSTAKLKADSPVLIQEGTKSAPAKTVGADEEKIDVSHSRLSEVMHSTDHENEDGMTFDETLEDHEYEGDDQRDGEYEYEQGDDGEYTYEEGDNVDPEEEYMDDEDGDDDFAKNIGVVS